jgi:hypothetical protein
LGLIIIVERGAREGGKRERERERERVKYRARSPFVGGGHITVRLRFKVFGERWKGVSRAKTFPRGAANTLQTSVSSQELKRLELLVKKIMRLAAVSAMAR